MEMMDDYYGTVEAAPIVEGSHGNMSEDHPAWFGRTIPNEPTEPIGFTAGMQAEIADYEAAQQELIEVAKDAAERVEAEIDFSPAPEFAELLADEDELFGGPAPDEYTAEFDPEPEAPYVRENPRDSDTYMAGYAETLRIDAAIGELHALTYHEATVQQLLDIRSLGQQADWMLNNR